MKRASMIMNLHEYFKIEESISWIQVNKFEKVALQFPESLFRHVTQVVEELQASLPSIYFVILADAKYGSCCVDEIACEHAQVDAVIHFGHSCLSRISRPNLNVKYIFGNEYFDASKLDMFLSSHLLADYDNLILFVDVVYLHAIDEIKLSVSKFCSNINYPELILPNNVNINYSKNRTNPKCCSNVNSNDTYISKDKHPDKISDGIVIENTVRNETENSESNCIHLGKVDLLSNDFNKQSEDMEIVNSFARFGRLFKLKSSAQLSDYTILFVGAESQFLSVFMMTFSKCKFIVFDQRNENLTDVSCNVNKILMKRYYMMEKARGAKFIGILIGTLNVSYYANIVKKLKEVIKRVGKKCRIYAPGTPNVAKLANVSEFDMFVTVACPENSLIDCSDYLQPIVTPFEMILACRVEFEWTGEYEVDFWRLCQLADENIESEISNATDISLVSGKLINFEDATMIPSDVDLNTQQLVAQNQTLTISESYLNTRTFQGLDPQLGETPVNKFIIGSKGVATGYTHEPRANFN